MDPCIVVWLSRNTNKMQLCYRIYYSKVFWRLNMFRGTHRSSSGALNCICSLWFICLYGDRPLPRLSGEKNGRSPYGHINQRLQIQFRAPDDERCAARNMLSLWKKIWNNKFYYRAASCWYFYWVIYDARIHEYQIYSMAVTSVRIWIYSIWPALYYTLDTGGTSQRTFFRLLRVPRREHSRPPPPLPLFIL